MSKPSQLTRLGFSIVEVLIGIAIAGMMVTVIGSSLGSIQRLYRASEHKQQALAYAVQAMERLRSSQNYNFACVCSTTGCTTCTRSIDSQNCAVRPGYNSCWTPYGPYLGTNDNLHLFNIGTDWELRSGPEPLVIGSLTFTRQISVENLWRDASGQLTGVGASGSQEDTNSKRVTVEISWLEAGQTKQFELTQIINAWENLQ